MDKNQALDSLCREGVFMLAPTHAEIVCNAFGTSLQGIGLEPRNTVDLAKESLSPSYPGLGGSAHLSQVKAHHKEDKAVFGYELAAKLALHFGLYANIDHAMQSPYHRATSECRYIACRAAIRLARLFAGGEGVAALRDRNPWVEGRLFKEEPYTGTGEKLRGTPAEKREWRKH